MTLFRTVEPDVEPVTLAEAKQNLRIDHDSDDELLSGLIRAAREEVEASCGLALVEQAWCVAIDRLPRSRRILLQRHPVRQVISVTVYGGDGEASAVDPARYQLDILSRPARLHLDDVLLPGVAMNGIEIDFTAGFGESGADVPDLIKRAILTLLAHWYEFRVRYGAGDQPVAYPPGYERLIAPYRSRRL